MKLTAALAFSVAFLAEIFTNAVRVTILRFLGCASTSSLLDCSVTLLFGALPMTSLVEALVALLGWATGMNVSSSMSEVSGVACADGSLLKMGDSPVLEVPKVVEREGVRFCMDFAMGGVRQGASKLISLVIGPRLTHHGIRL